MPSYSFNPFSRNARRLIIPDHTVSNFYGLNTLLSDLQAMPDGFSPDALNWITGDEKDCIILRRGYERLGKTADAGTVRVSGLGVGTRPDGKQVPFFSYGQKVKYYDATTDDVIEVGSNLLPASAISDDMVVHPYQNLAGYFVYISSQNSSVYKIPVANPGSAVDQLVTDYKGYFKFGQSRSLLWRRKGTNGFQDTNGLYMSYIDHANLSDYTQVTGEAVGVLGSKHYTHTATGIAAKKTIFQVTVAATVAAGTETFLDDKNGVLTSNFGGTGTINYATGAMDVTFSDTTTGAVTCSYYWEDATTHGVFDYSIATTGSPAVRTSGSGRYLSQFDGGGPLNAVHSLANVFYSFHTLKTWMSTVPTDDNDAGSSPPTNLAFRDKMGVSSPFSAYGSATGIYYINNANPSRPEVYVLGLFQGGTASNQAAPKIISQALNLSGYAFDKAVMFEWANYVILACQQIRNGQVDDFNSRTFIYNKKTGVWDLTDFAVSRLAEYMGTLIAGGERSSNLYTLFSGFDDDSFPIPNWWTSGATNHGVPGVKTSSAIVVNGLIQKSQQIEVSLALDGGTFVPIFTIDGVGDYVDSGKSIAVGSYVVGSKIAGGGAEVFANPFEVEIPVMTDRYEYIRIRFRALSGGYAQINFYRFKMNKFKGLRSPNERMVNTP